MYTEIGSYLGLRVNCEDNRFLFLSDGDITEEIKAKLLIIKDDINFGAYYEGEDRYLVIRKF